MDVTFARSTRKDIATDPLPQSWWYSLYFSPPTLSDGSCGVVTT